MYGHWASLSETPTAGLICFDSRLSGLIWGYSATRMCHTEVTPLAPDNGYAKRIWHITSGLNDNLPSIRPMELPFQRPPGNFLRYSHRRRNVHTCDEVEGIMKCKMASSYAERVLGCNWLAELGTRKRRLLAATRNSACLHHVLSLFSELQSPEAARSYPPSFSHRIVVVLISRPLDSSTLFSKRYRHSRHSRSFVRSDPLHSPPLFIYFT